MADVVVKKDLWRKIQANLRLAANSYVAVGFPEDAKAATAPHGDSGLTVLEVAVKNEMGSAPGIYPKTPARPFMKQTFSKRKREAKDLMASFMKMISEGKMSTKIALGRAGAWGQGEVRKEIGSGDFAPNSPVTKAIKGSDKPLIDTGLMRKSVTYKVRMRGSKHGQWTGRREEPNEPVP